MFFFGGSQSKQPLPSPPPRAADSGLCEEVPAGARWEAARRLPKKKRRLFFNNRRPEPLPSHFGTVEPAVAGKLGICCSGGGIRSAAFSLGALQGLEQRGEVRRASYLAAVSGGSYIAAAISMVNKTGGDGSDPEAMEEGPAFAPGSPEEQYLRNRCSYLAPTLMDQIYLGLRIVLGLLLNLAFVSLPLIGLALILAGALYVPALPELRGSAAHLSYQAVLPASFWWIPSITLAAGVAMGFIALLFRMADDRERFFTTWATRLLLLAVGLALILIGVPFLVERIREAADAGDAGSVLGGGVPKLGAGALALLAGVAAQLGHFLRSKPAEEEMDRAKKALGKLGATARKALVYAAGALVGPLLLVFVFGMTVAIGMAHTPRHGGHFIAWWLIARGLIVLVVFALIYALVDLTTWSLHPFYKRRLASAFALKRVRAESLSPGEKEHVEVLAGSPDSVAVERDYDMAVPISETAMTGREGTTWPTLLVCAAANISDTAATPPGRAVTSFTFSAKAVGGPLVGAIDTRELERSFGGDETATEPNGSAWRKLREKVIDVVTARGHRRHDLTLLAAVAMSGAAISPSMGKMTARPLRFLMALANVRLGVWVPNPRWVAGNAGGHFPTRPRPFYLLCELFGWNTVNGKYLYVTDGGHYENLGLVELLRRGCTEVYCLDASGLGGNGAEFESLGEAIALARSELGVEIEFGPGKAGWDPDELVPSEEEGEKGLAQRDVVTATIRYPKRFGEDGLEGTLVYVRNAMTAKAPVDVRAHHEEDARFPNNPTVDQLYTDQKFEAYRVLGVRAGANAYSALKEASR
jgi:hypothetical protein